MATRARIGIDLGGTKIEAIALDRAGTEIARKRIAAPRDSYRATVQAVRDLVLEVERSIATERPSTVGIGIPGAISPDTGLIKNANSTWLIGHPFDRDLAQALGRPVRIDNDANCLTLSEASDGAGAGYRLVFGVILGTGTGGGLVIDGRVHHGPNLIAGEWGHTPLPWREPDDDPPLPCYCGKRGCIETYLCGPALAAGFLAEHGRELSPPEIIAEANSGDAAAGRTLAVYERRLAKSLAMIVTAIDPDVIVLGGGLSNVERLYESVPVIWQEFAFSDKVVTPLKQAEHGDSSGVRGAAWLWSLAEMEQGAGMP